MGFIQSIAAMFWREENLEFRLQIIGFGGSGKTSIVKKMQMGAKSVITDPNKLNQQQP